MNYFKDNILSVSQLNEFIKMLLDSTLELTDLRIRGEISNFSNHIKSGHFYFSIKDKDSVIKAVMFARENKSLTFVPENGMKVLASGRVSSFPRDGVYQFYTNTLEPDGLGALFLAYEQLKSKLENEGLFDQKYKKPLPKFPRCVGVVTSPTGAVIRDIINVAKRRYPLAKILLFSALVQGATAVKTLIDGLNYFESSGVADVIIIGRGGGSFEDLWAFNDEKLARTIVGMKTPVISAVGHETDFTICDFAASVRAPTPSAAAEIALPNVIELSEKIAVYYNKMYEKLSDKLVSNKEKIDNFSSKFTEKLLRVFLENKRRELELIVEKLNTGIEKNLNSDENRFKILTEKLNSLSPLAVISRGYGVVRDQLGEAVNSVKQINCGDNFSVLMSDGTVFANAQKIEYKL